jgi:hypothetical protein
VLAFAVVTTVIMSLTQYHAIFLSYVSTGRRFDCAIVNA